MSRDCTLAAKQGFTLIEVLAALAVASVIVMATAGLLHNVVWSFDRGANRVSAGERLVLVADRLTTDIGSARFVLQGTVPAAVAFVGTPAKITFVGAGSVDPVSRQDMSRQDLSRQDEVLSAPEVVSVALEAGEETTALVRRRGAWRGSRSQLADAALRDEVVLLAGRFDGAFTFARMGVDGHLTWSSSWTGEQSLPRLVKLSLRDRASGVDLLGGAEFLIRADASRTCVREGAAANRITDPAGAGQGAPPASAAAPPGGRRE